MSDEPTWSIVTQIDANIRICDRGVDVTRPPTDTIIDALDIAAAQVLRARADLGYITVGVVVQLRVGGSVTVWERYVDTAREYETFNDAKALADDIVREARRQQQQVLRHR